MGFCLLIFTVKFTLTIEEDSKEFDIGVLGFKTEIFR